jgi:fructuronate reductase
MGFLASLMYWRFKAGAAPIALCSTDNFSHNGDKLKDAILQIVNVWVQKGFTEKEFLNYLNSEKVSFPLSMIDRITPLPSAKVAAELDSIGFEDTEIVKTSKGTVSAAFVNTEETHYLVIEDKFPNGRPPLEKADVIITSRDKVDKVEKMKVCTCLNPLHTSLAIFGCLLGANSISGEMKNPDLVKLVERIGYDEGLPVVVNPEIIDPKSFLDEVLQKRLPNPNIPDTPQRIATDTSQKLPIRFGETIKSYISENRDISQLKGIAFTFAGWIRYLMAVDDSGNAFERSPDPLLDELDKYIKPLKLGSPDCESVKKLLHDKTIFGVDLYEAKTGGSSSESSLADMTIAYLKEMLTGPGAIAAALKKHFG